MVALATHDRVSGSATEKEMSDPDPYISDPYTSDNEAVVLRQILRELSAIKEGMFDKERLRELREEEKREQREQSLWRERMFQSLRLVQFYLGCIALFVLVIASTVAWWEWRTR